MLGGPRTRRRSNQKRTKIFVTFGIFSYLIIGSVILALVFSNVWNVLSGLKQKQDKFEKETIINISDVNNTVTNFTPCLGLVCEEFPMLVDVAMLWRGCWNSLDNTTPDGPPVVSGVGENGETYRVCVPSANVTNIDGNSVWRVGDLIIFDEDVGMWLKVDGSESGGGGGGVTLTDPNIIGTSLIIDGIGPSLLIRKLLGGGGVNIVENAGTLEFSLVTHRVTSGAIIPTVDWVPLPLTVLQAAIPVVREHVPGLNYMGGIGLPSPGESVCNYIVIERRSSFPVRSSVFVQCLLYFEPDPPAFEFVPIVPCIPGCSQPFSKVGRLEIDSSVFPIPPSTMPQFDFVFAGQGIINSVNWAGNPLFAYDGDNCGVLINTAQFVPAGQFLFDVVFNGNCDGSPFDQRMNLVFSYITDGTG